MGAILLGMALIFCAIALYASGSVGKAIVFSVVARPMFVVLIVVVVFVLRISGFF